MNILDKKEPLKISLPLFIEIMILLVAIVYGIFSYMQNAKLEAEIANLRQEITQSQAAKNELQERLNNISSIASASGNESNKDENNIDDLTAYKGVWQYFETMPDTPEYELVINKIDGDKVNFDIFVYRIGEYTNINAKLSGNVASFKYSEDGRKMEGTITLENNTVIFKLTDSTEDDYIHRNVVFTKKAEKSVLK